MKKFSKVLSVILTLLMLLTAIPRISSAAIAVHSGTCGENLTWELDSDGVLTISGSGAMATDVPWNEYRDSIEKIIINDGVTSIGSEAFYYCTSLTQITIPESVTSIGSFAFYGCTSLTQITIPEGVTYINSHTFYYCTSLAQITIPESMTFIGNCAFYGCKSLPQITIPESVTYISKYAFYGCTSLTGIVVEEANPNYSSLDGVLYNKDKTTLICYPAGKTEASFDIPEGVTAIGSYAFYSCESLTEITIPESVTIIGSEAFRSCRSLTQITIPEGVTSIGSYAFYNCSSLAEIIIPESVTDIGHYAFSDCTSLAEITIAEGVTSIGNYAFYSCKSLTEITIPESVTSIGTAAFCNCKSLAQITILNPECEIYDGSTTIYDKVTIYGYEDSTAQAYAEKYNREFIAIADECEHEYVAVVTAPTCEEKGYITYTCECGESYTEYIDMTGHIDEDEDFKCDFCGATHNYCSHICHRDNVFAQFVWKIIVVICKLFGLSDTCACGRAHY